MSDPPRSACRLRVLATSDLHMHVASFDYYSDAPMPGRGLAALAQSIAALRARAEAEDPPRHVLLVDNGDLLQGSPLGDTIARDTRRTGTHPLAAAMNTLGYDAVGLGNHDLDFGRDYLEWFARGINAPLIASNLRPADAPDWLPDRAMLTVGPLRVGLFSVLPPHSVPAMEDGAPPSAAEMVATAARVARELRAAGADLVLGLAHTGLGGNPAADALAEIARAGVADALVGGHTHRSFPGPDHADVADADMECGRLAGIPTVMPGYAGELLGCIDLDLDRAGKNAPWKVVRASGHLIPATRTDGMGDAAFDTLRPPHEATRVAMNQAIAKVDAPILSYFTQLGVSSALALSASAQWHAIDAARQGTEWADLPLLSAVSSPRAGGHDGAWNYTDIPAGTLSRRHVAELHVYANRIWAIAVTGAELRAWLEQSASVFSCLDGAGGRAPLLNGGYAAFDFDVIHGLRYTIDPTRPAAHDRGNARAVGERIGALCHRGRPVRDADRFLIAVNSYRACGGGQFPGLGPDRAVLRPDIGADDALIRFLASGTAPLPANPWDFAPACTGVRTSFDTGPGALPHLHRIAHLSPGTPQLLPSGFVRLPITLAPRKDGADA